MKISSRLLLPALALAALVLPRPARALEFPKYEKVTKGNTTVILMQQDRVPLVEIRVTLDFSKAGLNYDPASAALYLHSIKYGSKNYPGAKWLETLDGAGAELHEDAQPFTITLVTEVRKEDESRILGLLLDGMFNPELNAEKVEQERGRLVAQARALGDQPQSLSEQAVDLAYFGSTHPYGHDATPTTLQAAKLSAPGFADCAVRAASLFVTVTGDHGLDAATVGEAATTASLPLAGVKCAASSGATVKTTALVSRRVILIDLPEETQTQIRLMVPGPTDIYSPLHLANVPFGSTFTSRLVKKLRTELGLTYGISSNLNQRPLASTYEISSFTKNASIGEFLKTLFAEIGKARSEGLSAEEIAKGKALMLGEGPMRWERYDVLAWLLERNALYGRPDDYPLTSIVRAQTVDARAANAALAAALPKDRYVLVLAGPLKLLKPLAAQYGSVEVWTKNQVIDPAAK